VVRDHHRHEVGIDMAGRLDLHADHHLRHRPDILGEEQCFPRRAARAAHGGELEPRFATVERTLKVIVRPEYFIDPLHEQLGGKRLRQIGLPSSVKLNDPVRVPGHHKRADPERDRLLNKAGAGPVGQRYIRCHQIEGCLL
jgi:hypothetical protein